MGEKRSLGANRIPDIIVLMMWAGAFLFLLNGERYRYYLAPAFGVTLAAGFVLSAAMGVALGRSRKSGRAGSWIGPTVRALVLVLPLIYAITTTGAILDSQAFTKRWISAGSGAGSLREGTRAIEGQGETDGGDDAELVEAYRAAGPPKISRALKEMLGLKPPDEPLPTTSTGNSGKSVFEADLYDLVEYAGRFKGRQVITEGMVAWDRVDSDRFYLFRFVIVCCIADAMPVAVVVERSGAPRPAQNSWIRVEGIADMITVDGQEGVVIRNGSFTSIPVPKDPYLY
ncbi:MAG: hypothetical protein A4E57_00847 [Syntrophorhabdaceae bacterium PtaU1.Bin034]|nr:MAG: hypothetical protein A4E57_00847 [Syntrophorhabdaceae bacterium PtaU1.Bin034]